MSCVCHVHYKVVAGKTILPPAFSVKVTDEVFELVKTHRSKMPRKFHSAEQYEKSPLTVKQMVIGLYMPT